MRNKGYHDFIEKLDRFRPRFGEQYLLPFDYEPEKTMAAASNERAGLLKLDERNFRSLTYRTLKGPLVVSWSLGLNAGEPHLRAAYEA